VTVFVFDFCEFTRCVSRELVDEHAGVFGDESFVTAY